MVFRNHFKTDFLLMAPSPLRGEGRDEGDFAINPPPLTLTRLLNGSHRGNPLCTLKTEAARGEGICFRKGF